MSSVTRTLAVALCSVGSLQRLAACLDIPEAQLIDWLVGRRQPPATIYVRALDVVARGPFTPRNKAR
jgi:hypothetical protein